MLSDPLNLNKVDPIRLFDYLYGYFHRDFIENKTYLKGKIWIDPRSDRLDDGKEMDFWHLTSRKQRFSVKEGNRYIMKEERLPDYRRSERIEWVRQIIINDSNPSLRCFYHQETDKRIRFYMWAHQDDFVVILQKLGQSTTFLVTSFYIDRHDKRTDFQQRFQRYQAGNAPELKNCEWF